MLFTLSDAVLKFHTLGSRNARLSCLPTSNFQIIIWANQCSYWGLRNSVNAGLHKKKLRMFSFYFVFCLTGWVLPVAVAHKDTPKKWFPKIKVQVCVCLKYHSDYLFCLKTMRKYHSNNIIYANPAHIEHPAHQKKLHMTAIFHFIVRNLSKLHRVMKLQLGSCVLVSSQYLQCSHQSLGTIWNGTFVTIICEYWCSVVM